MAKKVETIERDGRKIAVYDNGLERDEATGRIVKPAPNTVITPENATLLHRRRQEKASALLRDRIIKAHNRADMEPVRSSAEAFAESGALIYEEVVLNRTAYPRDRQEAWEKLGKYAQVLPSDLRKGTDDTANALQAAAVGANVAVAAVLERILRDVQGRQDVIEGKVSEE